MENVSKRDDREMNATSLPLTVWLVIVTEDRTGDGFSVIDLTSE
jgi:hypothetical protein